MRNIIATVAAAAAAIVVLGALAWFTAKPCQPGDTGYRLGHLLMRGCH